MFTERCRVKLGARRWLGTRGNEGLRLSGARAMFSGE